MTAWAIAVLVGAVAAALQYGRLRAPPILARSALGVLRGLAIAVLVALLLDAPLARPSPTPPIVFVDASASMDREHAALARAAWDSADAIGAESTYVFGATVRTAARSAPADAASRIRPIVERTMAEGRPAVLITDGEVQDTSALEGLTNGSRVIVLARRPAADVAIASMDSPRAAVAGDSIAVRLTVASGAMGAAEGTLLLRLDDHVLGRWPLAPMSPWSERLLDVRVPATGVPNGGLAILQAIVSSAGDAEPRNDTLSASVELSRVASAVFVSTSPDEDARFALAVLRGALALPTRGFLRVAPGRWRQEGSLAATTEAEVRQALKEAPVAILHGDTAIFGPPRDATLGPLALMIPASDADDWYPSAVPASPLSGALAAIPLESLPPVSAGLPARGDWVGLEVRRGREAVRRPIVVGRDSPRRIVVVTGSRFWRWRFRGGASADAFAALWGGIFDWLAADRADRRSAVPEENVLRAGQLVRWRRGSSADSTVRVVLSPRSGGNPDTIALRFSAGSAISESQPLAAGIYDVAVPGGSVLLAVNASTELLPARPTLSTGPAGHRARPDDAPRARSSGLLYALAIVLLCGEWIARRRAGLR